MVCRENTGWGAAMLNKQGTIKGKGSCIHTSGHSSFRHGLDDPDMIHDTDTDKSLIRTTDLPKGESVRYKSSRWVWGFIPSGVAPIMPYMCILL